MRHLFSLLAAVILAGVSSAQNIVVNPDMEQYFVCPNSTSQLNKCVGWQNVGNGTADYFNACDTEDVSVPLNSAGYQLSASGDGYAGVFAFYASIQDYREYAKGRLVNMLAGQSYKVSIKVSLSGIEKYAVDGLGILFTCDSLYLLSSNTVQPFTPQIDFSGSGVINDTTNWITLTDTFYADSAYKHLVIGGFKPDSLLAIDTLTTGFVNASYYYVDDVAVEELPVNVADHTNQKNIITIYPHPLISSSEVRFGNPEKKPHTFSLYNVQGQLVQCISGIDTEEFRISKGHLAPGFYYYRLQGAQNSYPGKLIVE